MKIRLISLSLVACMLLALLAGCTDQNGGATTTPINKDLPDYTAGQITKQVYDKDTTLTYSEGSSYAQFQQYCADMTRAGYETLYSRETTDLHCQAFLDGEDYIYAYYAKHTGEARVIRGPKNTFDAGQFQSQSNANVTPTLTMIGQQKTKNNGQGFVFVLPDGRLLIQDGGHWYDNTDTDIIYNAIKTVAPDSENIVIAGWFISHPHSDHIGAFLKFVTDYSQDSTITIERVICNFGEDKWYDFERQDGTVEASGHYVLEMDELCRTKLPNTQVVKAHTGQVLDFGSAQVEIMHTTEDLLPAEDLGYINSSSMVIRVYVAGQTVLLLADTTSTTASTLVDMYSESLSSDMVQLAHHGMWAGNKMLYFYTMAPVLLWPTLKSVAVDWLTDTPAMEAIKQAQDIYVADSGLTTLELPYTVQQNKMIALKELEQYA